MGADLIRLEEIQEFQGDLKELQKTEYDKLKKLILKYGFSFPFFIWKNGKDRWCLDGHQRKRVLLKMREEGIEMPDKFPCDWIDAKTKEEAKRKVLAATMQAGKMTGQGLYEFMTEAEISFTEMTDLYRFPEIDFKKFEEEYFKLEPVEGQDDAPSLPNKPRSIPGDLFIMGEHRLLCGDATSVVDVERLMNGHLADMVFTDPPYNIAYEGGTKKRDQIKNDEMTSTQFCIFLMDSYVRMFDVMKSGAPIYVCHADTERVNFTAAFLDTPFKLSSVLVWAKNNATFGRQDYFWKHEPILYGWKEGSAHKWYGPNNEETIWNIDRPSKSEEHPTMKPIALIERALKNSSKSGDLLFEPFSGSGSTMIACEKMQRRCYGLELDPGYCDVIVQRWEKFTGKKAILEKASIKPKEKQIRAKKTIQKGSASRAGTKKASA